MSPPPGRASVSAVLGFEIEFGENWKYDFTGSKVEGMVPPRAQFETGLNCSPLLRTQSFTSSRGISTDTASKF